MALEEVTFTSTAADADNDIVSWEWDFGDGTTGSGSGDQTHTYAAVGDYEVKLTVKDSCGVEHTHTEVIAVRTDEGLGCPRKNNGRGNPCDAGTGNKYEFEVDYASPTLSFIRSYNSQMKADLGLGYKENQ